MSGACFPQVHASLIPTHPCTCRLVWSRIWAVLADFFVEVGCHPNLQVRPSRAAPHLLCWCMSWSDSHPCLLHTLGS